MSGFARAKRVTDPLDDKAKARLIGCQLRCSSSGSEHSADHDDSPCLSGLVHGFLEEEDSDFAHESTNGHGSDSERVGLVIDCTDFVEDTIRSSSNDSYRNLLFFHVSKAMEGFSCLRNQRPVLRRKVMSSLRELGHNAAICKTKWESSGGGLTAGSYELIDVVLQLKSPSSLQSRYVVDLDFASQFEIARPTSQYLKLLHHLPRVFVGKSEDLKTIVKSISDAARRSLKSGELYLPPWRKNRYMQNKWFGPYRRTVNPLPANSFTSPPPVNVVKCRRLGFDAAVNGRLFVRT
ncbi:IMPORT ATP-BINDING PROTEIN putative (DUF506)-RELATED [Salix viminalis]|uniref:IMPORT ATP-BINDING PROTEIN putative (DUF506)-RELATED n=1 Tax=Salix viminalis TaxID=40686 RepID=A0A9Q0QK02_SALVM|nr:IMPORT ATP-BINDING PROTEIN putative (DUF506)-RELATED [Salix viminalis]